MVLAVAALAGCSRVSTNTALHADGSFSRQVVYTVTKNDLNLGGQQQKAKPEDLFKLPASGNGVTVASTDNVNGTVVTVTRDVSADSSPLADISLLGDKKSVSATSTVSVKKLADGKLEYIETLHAATPAKSSVEQFLIPDLRARVKKALPEEYQKTELIDRLTVEIQTNMVHALVGPPEANLFSAILSPDTTARKINATAFALNLKSFKSAIPTLSDDQASSLAKSLSNMMNKDTFNASNSSKMAGENASPDNTAMTLLFFSVNFPGKIVETNGIADPLEGDVYWSLLPMALDLGDVHLRVVVQP